MTPDDRMKFMVMVQDYDNATNPRYAIQVMQVLIEFVEYMEFQAHSAGQDLQIALHEEHLKRNRFCVCDWRKDI